jgi:hypothetical protein
MTRPILPSSPPTADEGTFSFDSFGYAAGGAEPYFTLFAGNGTADESAHTKGELT